MTLLRRCRGETCLARRRGARSLLLACNPRDHAIICSALVRPATIGPSPRRRTLRPQAIQARFQPPAPVAGHDAPNLYGIARRHPSRRPRCSRRDLHQPRAPVVVSAAGGLKSRGESLRAGDADTPMIRPGPAYWVSPGATIELRTVGAGRDSSRGARRAGHVLPLHLACVPAGLSRSL